MVRTSNDLYLLCEVNFADKKNSHIIPSFFKERLLSTEGHKYMIYRSDEGKESKIQDIPKEDHIFCSDCEKKFEILETYCANQLFKKVHYKQLKKNQFSFKKKMINNQITQYFECKRLNPNVFHLFIKSLVWRASISISKLFNGFYVPESEVNCIREELLQCLKLTQGELLQYQNKPEIRNNTSFILLTQNQLKITPKSTLSGFTRESNFAVLNLVDYVLWYSTSHEFPMHYKLIENFNDGQQIKIGLVTPDIWDTFHKSYMNKFIKKNLGI